ncbi:MAG: NUDIX domain-containing protein [Candidatus Paceibacterota bacterium]
MQKISAGLLMFRKKDNDLEFLLGHPGGPFFKSKKDEGVWSIPKGERNDGEELLDTAKREFEEETNIKPESEKFIPLGEVKYKNGKIVHAWGFEGDADIAKMKSNTFQMEWPPKSGQTQDFLELDKFEFLRLDEALIKIKPAQADFLTRLKNTIDSLD